MPPMMKCGHAANATMDGKPACAICAGLTPLATVVDDAPPSLEGRIARCTYCGKEQPSSPDLWFFSANPDREHDYYYCGCWGVN
jgi:hypothetical protein